MSPACSSISVPAAAYVSQDNENHRIRKINVKSGETSTLAGSSEGFKDGVGTSAQFSYPIGVAIDPEGAFVFVAVRMPVARIPASKSIFPQTALLDACATLASRPHRYPASPVCSLFIVSMPCAPVRVRTATTTASGRSPFSHRRRCKVRVSSSCLAP